MKYVICLSLLLPLTLASLVASAQTATNTPETDGAQNERATDTRPLQDRVEAARENIAERRAALNERAQERLINLAANISNRFDATISRLRNISDRLESRANKLAATGQDVTAAQADIANARAQLDEAFTAMSTIDERVLAVAGASDARAAWQDLRAVYEQVRFQLVAARGNLQTAISLLRNPVAPASNADETVATTTNPAE
jgi:DNA repair exonuclease SbcCD ATPase subunit